MKITSTAAPRRGVLTCTAACLAGAVLLSALLFACAGSPQAVQTAGLSPAEYFQKAQEATDAGRYALAMRYYQDFRKEYPNDVERDLWAQYEIAFLYYKMQNYKAALEQFDALLAHYATGSQDLPQGPRILAEKIEAEIENKINPPAP
jgi:outer membrane protein assembly factor BamD (BamD/ComL family)